MGEGGKEVENGEELECGSRDEDGATHSLNKTFCEALTQNHSNVSHTSPK